MFRNLAADDIFISYSRGDAAIYADGLADALSRKGFSVFIDRLGTKANARLSDSLLRKLRGASMLVLIGSPCAAASEFVGQEVAEFSDAGRSDRIVPIGFNNAVAGAVWFSNVEGIPMEAESEAALETGEVSIRVVSRIEKAFRYTRSKDRLQRYTWGTLSLLALLVLLSAGAGLYAREQLDAANDADRRASNSLSNARVADARTLEAQSREASAIASASSAVADANAQRAGAEGARDRAVTQAAVASQEAQDQQRVATALRLANESKAAQGTSFDDLVQSIRLAVQSVELQRTRSGMEALREGLSRVARPDQVRTLSFTRGAVWTSPSGRALALRRGHDQLQVWKEVGIDKVDQAASSTIRLPPDHEHVALSDDGRWVASAISQLIRLHDTVRDTACEHRLFENGDEFVIDIAISGSGGHVAALVAQEEIFSLYVWQLDHLESGACRWRPAVRRLGDVQFDRPQRARFSLRAGKPIVTLHGHQDFGGSYHSYMRSFEIASGEKGSTVDQTTRLVETSVYRNQLGIAVAESQSGDLTALVNQAANTCWILRRNALGGYEEPLRVPLRGQLLGASFHGGDRLALYLKVGSDAVLRSDWNSEGIGKPVGRTFEKPLDEIAGLPNGRLMTVHRNFDGEVTRSIWDTTNGLLERPLLTDDVEMKRSSAIRLGSGEPARATSMDGKLVATRVKDRIVRVHRPGSDESLEVLSQADPVTAIAFLQGDRYLAVATAPRSPDTSGGVESAIDIWRLNPKDLVREACAHVPAICAPVPSALGTARVVPGPPRS
jgi:hypothetical protein